MVTPGVAVSLVGAHRLAAAAAAGIAVACLAGCAGSPISTSFLGGAPDPRGVRDYVFARAASPADRRLEPAVEAQLQSRGFVRATGVSARFTVEVGDSARPLEVGEFVSPQDAPESPSRSWLAAPGHRHWWSSHKAQICVVSIGLWDTQSGARINQVRATTQRRHGDCAAVGPALVQAAFAASADSPR